MFFKEQKAEIFPLSNTLTAYSDERSRFLMRPSGSKVNRSIGELLLEEAMINRSDLLITGGYGHAHSREFIFGGAATYILGNMAAPVISCINDE